SSDWHLPPPSPVILGAIYLSHWYYTPASVDAISRAFNAQIESREEGLVVKAARLPGFRHSSIVAGDPMQLQLSRIDVSTIEGEESTYSAQDSDEDMEDAGKALDEDFGYSAYYPGARLRAGWWKLKPDYVLQLMDDFDCLLVGAFLSPSTERQQMASMGAVGNAIRRSCGGPIISQFLCAVKLNETNETSDNIHTFLSFCRVSILTFADLINLLLK
ncbi:unnamed protein product, partial [Protopolystoma xenopodis]